MENVAAIHGTGTFDHTMRKWKIRTQELTASASIRQLSKMFRVEVPNTERESRPYWLQYLEELRKAKTVTQAESELQAAKKRYANDDPPEYSPFERDTASGEVRRKTPLNFDQIRILNAASQIQNPDTQPAVRDWLLQQLAPKPVPKAESLKEEIASAIERAKARNPKGKGWFSIRQFLEMFGDTTGDISFRDITVKHYRSYWEKVKAEKWSDRNRANAMQTLNTFLKRLEADHDLRFSFKNNPEYRIAGGEGKKLQYSLEQVKTALQNAKGIARTALLFGLNCGLYWGDIRTLKPEHFIDGYMKKARQKNEKKDSPVIGTWKLWPETIEALQYGLTKWQLEEAYRQLRAAHNLPEHKALRKTIAQLIQDEVGETEARLYRCEGVGGTHGRSYIKNFTPPQIAKLEAALKHVHARLFE